MLFFNKIEIIWVDFEFESNKTNNTCIYEKKFVVLSF